MDPQWVIGVTGEWKAGKGTTVEIIETACGKDKCCVVDGGELLTNMLRSSGCPTPDLKSAQLHFWIQRKNELRDPEWFNKEIEGHFRVSDRGVWILSGFRMPGNINLIRKYPEGLIFCVSAPRKRRVLYAQIEAKKIGNQGNQCRVIKDFGKLQKKDPDHFVATMLLRMKADRTIIVHNTRTFRDLGEQIISALLTKRVFGANDIALQRNALQALYEKLESQETSMP